jgi:hypothetical protein
MSYRNICSVMHQLRNRKLKEKRLLIMVNYSALKRSRFNKRSYCTLKVWFYYVIFISLPGWPNMFTLCTMVYGARFCVFREDHPVQKSRHLFFRQYTECYRNKISVRTHLESVTFIARYWQVLISIRRNWSISETQLLTYLFHGAESFLRS